MTHSLRTTSLRPAAGLVVGLAGLLAILALPAHTAASSQGFSVLQGQPQMGMLMSLTADPGVVEEANASNTQSLVGVIAPNNSDFNQQAGQINVQTDGVANALVSTLGGNISVGDRITSSSLEGIGTKISTSGWIIGTAQASLDDHTTGAVKTTFKDSTGASHTVYVASIPLVIKVTYYSTASASADSTSWAPVVVQRIADDIAGKHVSTKALILGFLIFVIGVIGAGTVINSAIRGGFLAIARQPLAKRVILHEEWRSFGLALAILVFALAAVVLLLRIL